MIFTSVTKILLGNFWNNFRNYISSGGLSRGHYWRGNIQEIHDFRSPHMSPWQFPTFFNIFQHFQLFSYSP